jgi:putative hydrolase of the HAD superfamily
MTDPTGNTPAPEPIPVPLRPVGPLRAVLFDLFHTLIDVNSAPGPSSSELLGIDPLLWNRTIIEEAHHHALGTVTDPYESVRIIVHSIDPSIAEDRIRAAVEARPRRFRHALTHVRPEILSALARIREMGMRTGLISNAGYDEVEAWRESPLCPLMDAAFFSCHEHLMKPDPEIYLRAARTLGVAPAACLFVGDGGSREHTGARAAGMRTVLTLGLLEESLPEIAARRPRDTDYEAGTIEGVADLVASLVEHSSRHPRD